jgi:phosphate starvation-inducible PhoH-like protein
LTKSQVTITRGIESLFGTHDENIRLLEDALGVTTHLREDSLEIEGEADSVRRVEAILSDYEDLVHEGHRFTNGDVKNFLKVVAENSRVSLRNLVHSSRKRAFGRKNLAPRSLNQMVYFEAMERCDMVFGIGPAGTGKTYLAVAMAVSELLSKRVQRIVLTRPAVEAGERLGFLPGTLQQKIDPYLRPLYDALYDMLEAERVEKLIEHNTIEIAPLAFMRGRSLNESFIILDEAQNATAEQMKMFITRLGFGSKAVITGDVTQIDLPAGKRSGLLDAVDVLHSVEGISFVYFNEKDVVRHDLVQRIIRAYDQYHQTRLEPAQAKPEPPPVP